MPRPEWLPFDRVETSFRLLTTGPRPLALDGRQVGHGLPARPIPLDELRARLLHPSTSFAARDAAMAVLLARAGRRVGRPRSAWSGCCCRDCGMPPAR